MIYFNDFRALKDAINNHQKAVVFIDPVCAKLLNTHEKFSELASVVSGLNMHILPPGEQAKSFKELERALDFLCEQNLSRRDLVLNIGGGICSDLGGLAAALYKRGCSHINIPTTLLAAADASIGGKTGINNQFGKNLIGVFKEPKEVFIFDDLLATLPSEQLSCGWAEIIKMIACFDKANFAQINTLSQSEALKIAINIKSDVVARDLCESGLRMLLNYGHTFAHAIEHEQNYNILHGQAVSAGMLMADKLAQHLGLLRPSDELQIALQRRGCLTRYQILDIENFIGCMRKDKKNQSDEITFILRTDEDARAVCGISANTLRKVLASC